MRRLDEHCKRVKCEHLHEEWAEEVGGMCCALVCDKILMCKKCRDCEAVKGDVPSDCPYLVELAVLMETQG